MLTETYYIYTRHLMASHKEFDNVYIAICDQVVHFSLNQYKRNKNERN